MNTKRIALLAAVCAYCTLCSAQVPGEKQIRAKQNLDKVIGTIKWFITDETTGKQLSKGYRKVLLGEAVAREIDGPGMTLVKMCVPLSSGFKLRYQQNPLNTGFGLTLDKENGSTFSWEWFEVRSKTRATKMQESGELGITISSHGGESLIHKMDFLTDVSFRSARFMVDRPGTVHWRARIAKGSTIVWPYIRNGQVVAD